MSSRLARMAFGGSFLWAAVGAGGQGLVARAGELPRTASALLAASAGVLPRKQPEPAPAQANPAPAATSATIVAVEGKVRYRLGADKPWEGAKAGVVMGEGAEVETALRSAVQIKIGEGQVLTIDRASRVAIKEAIRRGGTEKTTVDLPYGRVKFDVSSASVANDVKIQAPDATLAVKGTQGYMEVTPGQPTLAAGDTGNTGSFEVAYEGGTTATVSDDVATDATNQDPASNAVEVTQIDVGSPAARTEDEAQVITRAPGGGESLVLVAPGVSEGVRNTPPVNLGSTDILFIEDDGNKSLQLIRRNVLTDERLVLRTGSAFSQSLDFGSIGLALGRSADGTQRELFRLEFADSGGGFQLLGLTFGTPDSVFQVRATNSTQNVVGLGALGGQLFTMGLGGQFDRHMLEISIGSGSLSPRVHLPFGSIGSDLAGSNERGTIWMYGAGSSRGTTSFMAGGFFEIDPRTNHVIRSTGPLITGETTVFEEGLSGSVLNGANVRGLAFAGGSLIVQVDTQAGVLFLTVNIMASGTAASPTITHVVRAVGSLPGLASETFNNPAASGPLAPLGQGFIDPAISPLLAMMAVGPNAAASNVFQQMIIGQIIDTATDPTLCASSGVFGPFGTFLATNVNRVGGVGLAVNQFRESLGNGHPCLFPGQIIQTAPLLYLDTLGNLIGRNLAGMETVQRSGLVYNLSTAEVGGLALVSVGPSRQLFRLEANAAGQVLRSLDLNSAGSTFQSVANYPVQGPLLGGLGSIGSQLFTGGIPRSGINQFNEYTIFELMPTLNARVTIPFEFVDPEIAGSNERGSLFITGEADDSVIRGSIFEIDPRNNYMRNIVRIEFGPSTILPAGFDPAIIDEHDIVVTGSAYVGNRLILGIRDDTTGVRYFVEIDPNALGTSGSPTIVRITQSTRHILGLAGESGIAPPNPTGLSAPSTMVDPSVGLFGQVAYPAVVAANDAFRRLVANAIVLSAVDPVACRSQLDLNIVGSFLAGHVNEMGGVGQAVGDFRSSLSVGHPCLVPGPAGNLDNQVFYVNGTPTDLRVLNFAGVALQSDGGFATTNFPATSSFGLAFGRNGGIGGGTLYQLQTTGVEGSFNTAIRSVSLGQPTANPATTATLSGGSIPFLFGLGVIEGPGQTRFFAPGLDPFNPADGVFEIFPGNNNFARVGSFPLYSIDLAFTGSNATGSLFMVATDSTITTPAFEDRVMLDFDPRNNFLRDASPFSVGGITNAPANFVPSLVTDVLGLAFINGQLIMSVVDNGGQRFFLQYNPNAAGDANDPTVRTVNQTNNFPFSFAANIPGPAPNPMLLGDETSAPDLRVDPFFGAMGYNGSARVRNIVRGMVEELILDNSADLNACTGTSEFSGLASLIANHAGQFRGAGQVLSDFYNGIDYLHPCQVDFTLNRYALVDESTGTLREFDIDSTFRSSFLLAGSIVTIDRSNPDGLPSDGGFTLYQNTISNGLVFALRLETTRTSATTAQSQLRWRGPNDLFTPLGSPINTSGGVVMSGLGTVGNQVFTGLIGPGTNIIREINSPIVSPLLGPVVIDIPNLGFGGTIAMGNNARKGSLYVSATIDGSLGILELDPRNNYLADAYAVSQGQIVIDGNTVNGAPAFSSFFNVNGVTAIAHNNGLLTVHGQRSDNSQNIIFTIDTGGANGTGRPIVGATQQGLAGPGPFGAVGTLPARPLAPLNLTDPGGAIDLRGLTAQFADLAYSQRALNSGVVGSIARGAIINSASDPSGCASSSELSNGLGPALQNRVSQRAGMGRAITDFRAGLPGGHPCLPPP